MKGRLWKELLLSSEDAALGGCGRGEMINIWGVCEIGEISHDPLRKWDFGCTDFCPCRAKREEALERCCANCIYWLPSDERESAGEKLERLNDPITKS